MHWSFLIDLFVYTYIYFFFLLFSFLLLFFSSSPSNSEILLFSFCLSLSLCLSLPSLYFCFLTFHFLNILLFCFPFPIFFFLLSIFSFFIISENFLGQVQVICAHNPSYLEGWDQKDHGSRPVRIKKFMRPPSQQKIAGVAVPPYHSSYGGKCKIEGSWFRLAWAK
jgi:hypothetical protein